MDERTRSMGNETVKKQPRWKPKAKAADRDERRRKDEIENAIRKVINRGKSMRRMKRALQLREKRVKHY